MMDQEEFSFSFLNGSPVGENICWQMLFVLDIEGTKMGI